MLIQMQYMLHYIGYTETVCHSNMEKLTKHMKTMSTPNYHQR